MKRTCMLLGMVLGSALAAPAGAEFLFRMGNTVYVDGKAYDWEEWKKIRDDPHRRAAEAAPPAAAAAPAANEQASAVPAARSAPKAAVEGPLAASCVTSSAHEEFPPDEERFECSAALGALTREQILRAGWKIDLIEKVPASAQSPRGLPLYKYKLVISR